MTCFLLQRAHDWLSPWSLPESSRPPRHSSIQKSGMTMSDSSASSLRQRPPLFPERAQWLGPEEAAKHIPCLAVISATDLARPNVLSMGPEGRANCLCCGSELSYQAASDGAGQDHHRLPHLCGRVLHWDCVDGQILSQLHPLSEEGEEGEEGEEATSPAEPAFPGMDSEELRLASFYNWPPTSGVQPEPLAAAGFFHTGQEDKVRCFFCCGGLQSWEHGDDPWTEHAKWFPRCQFLLQSKGRSFVHSVQEAYSPQLSSWEQWEEPEEAAPASHSGISSSQPVADLLQEDENQEVARARAVEAGDLQEQLRRLQEERTCKVCLDHSVSVVFVPCGHLVCAECAPSLQLCPICRAPIRSWVRTFLS